MAFLGPRTQIALYVALQFLIVGSSTTYDLTDKYIAENLGLDFVDGNGVPTRLGLVVHALVAGLLTTLYLHTFRM